LTLSATHWPLQGVFVLEADSAFSIAWTPFSATAKYVMGARSSGLATFGGINARDTEK
jgi:hypothetical protein